MYNTLKKNLVKISLFVSATITVVGCEKEPAVVDGPEDLQNFIPQGNKKFVYAVTSDGAYSGTVTQWLSGKKDSAGIDLFNLHTLIETAGGSTTLNNRIFSKEGKTYTELKVPEAWHQTVAILGTLPKVNVTKSEVFGYPAYMTMENAIREGSKLSIDGPLEQGQLIEYSNDSKPCSVEQRIVLLTGTSEVETIEVPAGSFVCNRFEYEMATTIKSKVEGKDNTSNGNEHVTIWVAHGIGMVKQQSISQLVTLLPLPSGEVKEIITMSNSTTTLKEIK